MEPTELAETTEPKKPIEFTEPAEATAYAEPAEPNLPHDDLVHPFLQCRAG